MSLKVLHYPHPVLRHVSQPIKKVDRQLREWIAEMFELMYDHEGIGLAANQVGLPYRLFVINPTGDPDQPDSERVYINPVISKGKGLGEREEGCLSLPDVNGPVTRNTTIHVQSYNLAGEEINETIDGLHARVVLHETDHLDGILFTDKLSLAEKSEIDGLLYEFEVDWQSRQQTGDAPTDQAVTARIIQLESERC